jgi:hypothetical protein
MPKGHESFPYVEIFQYLFYLRLQEIKWKECLPELHRISAMVDVLLK